VNNSTFFGNSAQASGGAIGTTVKPVTVQNSTIVGNSAAGNGGFTGGTVPAVSNSIISGNTGGDCSKCTGGGTNLIGGTAALGPLQNNGGPTPTMMPLSTGVGIIGAGLNSTLATDQRGFTRPTSGASDLGAVQTYNLVVTTTNDTTNSGTTCTGGDPCSLRDAITLADSHSSGDIIPLAGLQGTIALASPLPDITTNINISGPGANLLTISGGNAFGVFNVTNPNAITNFSALTIANGSSSSNGAGISNNGSALTLSNCALSNNSATGGASGGGLANDNVAGSATITDCTLSGNSALNGGGVYNLGSLLVTNSTFTSNTAPGTAGSGSGGGIFNQGTAQVMSSTISGNTAGTGGGISNNASGAITVVNSVVAGNTEVVSPGNDCSSCGTQTPFNLISTTGAPITGAQVMLGPLAYNGLNQTVQTLLPFPGSPAIETGDPTQLSSGLTTDERQLPRTTNSKLDLGAVQTNYTSIQFVQQPSNTNVNAYISPAVTMSVTESGTTEANVPLPVTFVGTGALHGTLTESTVAPGIVGDPALASFANLSGDTAGTGNTLVSTVTVTPAGVTPAVTLTATSDPFNILALPISVPTATINPTTPTYGQPVTVTITVPVVGTAPPTGIVTIYYNGNPIGTGTLGPNGTVIVTLPGGTLPAGMDSITVGYSGDINYGSSTSAPVQVTVTQPSDFTVSSSTGPQTILPGQNSSYTISVASANGAFNKAVILSTSGLPAGITATFNPPSVTPGSSPATTTMTIQTTKQSAELLQSRSSTTLMLGLLLPLFGLCRGKRNLRRCGQMFLFAMLSIVVVIGLTGCSGGFFGQSPRTYTVTVTGISGSLQHATTVTLTVQ
jgi:trimeric autotransporter adhesin